MQKTSENRKTIPISKVLCRNEVCLITWQINSKFECLKWSGIQMNPVFRRSDFRPALYLKWKQHNLIKRKLQDLKNVNLQGHLWDCAFERLGPAHGQDVVVGQDVRSPDVAVHVSLETVQENSARCHQKNWKEKFPLRASLRFGPKRNWRTAEDAKTWKNSSQVKGDS